MSAGEWRSDPFGRYELRFFHDGGATAFVRDGPFSTGYDPFPGALLMPPVDLTAPVRLEVESDPFAPPVVHFVPTEATAPQLGEAHAPAGPHDVVLEQVPPFRRVFVRLLEELLAIESAEALAVFEAVSSGGAETIVTSLPAGRAGALVERIGELAGVARSVPSLPSLGTSPEAAAEVVSEARRVIDDADEAAPLLLDDERPQLAAEQGAGPDGVELVASAEDLDELRARRPSVTAAARSGRPAPAWARTVQSAAARVAASVSEPPPLDARELAAQAAARADEAPIEAGERPHGWRAARRALAIVATTPA